MATLYNQYIYKNGAWMKIGTSSDSVTYALSYSALTGLLTLTGSDGSTSTVTIESGSSDAITGITVNGTTVTVTDGVAAISVPTTLSAFTNDVGYITSYTETDPVFRASAAAGITATDISNWNAKSNTDEKVKQTPLNGMNSGKGLLFGYNTGNLEQTNIVYTSDKLMWNDYSQELTLYNSNRTVKAILRSNTLILGYDSSYHGTRITASTVTDDVILYLPTTSGTLALISDTPAQASINSTGLITYKNSGGTSLFTLQLPLYNGGVS